ncbi:purine and uridine phosphorylase [Lindgomyces ingoldianus]|uniref:Purine and uridine phosphorylase n=1 Tax=Lindgomyces ingoldianus TaxID=673940 RepID=A0ACB6QX78_9PLEO|nr:purine and uridine phosphorylase [Lindgomyces ingoldianus]KAF2471639.1 purine and uridine phosphorylase [Lindgomyces ingoldianus]
MESTRYTVGWIAPLYLELIAAKSALEQEYDEIYADGYRFYGGRIGEHNVVLGVQPTIGTDAASDLAARMSSAFPNIRFFLVVGIGGGVPRYGVTGAASEIVLGDVVVSYPWGNSGGVIRYDSGAWVGEDEGRLKTVGHTNGPPHALLGAVNNLRADHATGTGTIIPILLKRMRLRIHENERHRFEDPGPDQDILFQDDCSHPTDLTNVDCQQCCGQDFSQQRKRRGNSAVRQTDTPKIHYGNIGSSNQLQISPAERNRLQKDHGIICFEMEGAGVIQRHPCLIVRGICDYSDSHKNKIWQAYAAVTAAAYTKELLESMPAIRKTGQIEDCSQGVTSVFPRLQEEINKRIHPGQRSSLLDHLPYADDAAFNSSTNQHDPLCLPNTRVDLLQEIYNWGNGQDERLIFWLNGLAGTGKSTIARTVARTYFDKKRLGASFFFSRGGGDVSHAGKFFTTISKQLATSIPPLHQHIRDAIKAQDDIVKLSFQDQWRHLVLGPLSKLTGNLRPPMFTIVIDALDECSNENDIQILLHLLADARSLDRVRLRIFLTSRPEVPIRYGLCQISDAEYGEYIHQDYVLHRISPSIVDQDIRTFLEYNFERIRHERSLDISWPGEEVITSLVQIASGLFIWAATACRFIHEGRKFAPKRLNTILTGRGGDVTAPEKYLDQIYITVLKHSISPDYTSEEKEEVYCMLRRVLGSTALLFSPLSACALKRLLNVTEDIYQTLDDLHSVLDVPKSGNQPLRLHHPSFRDFLLNHNRCEDQNFWVDETQTHQTLASNCIRLMSTSLKENICGLNSPGIRATEVDSSRVQQCLPPELQYACLYWIQHFQRSRVQFRDNDPVHQFLKQHLLHWFEALGWMGKISEGIHAIASLELMIVARHTKVPSCLNMPRT